MSTIQGGGRIITDGLILYYDFANAGSYTGSGPLLQSLVQNENISTLISNPTFALNYYGELSFDGNTQYISSTFSNPFAETVIVWAKSSSSIWNQNGWLSSSRSQNGHIIHPLINTGSMRFYILNSSSTVFFMGVGTPSTPITNPHMYSLTTNGSNRHKGFIDELKVVDYSTSITRTSNPSPQTWWIGRDTFGVRYGLGSVYLVMRYNRELTESEIEHNHKVLKSRFGQ